MRRMEPEEGGGVLAASEGVSSGAAVAEADVEIAVGAEGDLSAVVVLVGLLDFEDDQLAVAVNLAVARVVVEPGNHGAPGVGRRVVNVNVRVVSRVEGQSQQALLGTAAVYLLANVEGLGGQVLLVEYPETA